MLDPDAASDILLDPVALAEWAEDREMLLRQAVELLRAMAEGASSESRLLRVARETHASRGRVVKHRTDVEELVGFVERAVGLPPRVREVFRLCIVDGMSHAECAEHLGIAPATVRVHLRRLRRTMRRCGEGGKTESYPGFS